MKRVLITGAAGNIGRALRSTLATHFSLRLSDVEPLDDLAPGEEFVQADVRDLDAMQSLCAGIDGVVHLGGVSLEAAWQPINEVNIGGTYNLYEAARCNRVKRVVFATSNHAVGFYPREETIAHDVTARPDSRYGVSKAFGEAIGSLYAYKYGVQGLGIRIGNMADAPIDVRRLSIWISPRDLTQLVRIGLEHPDIVYEIVYGMSDNQRAWWDNSNAMRLGYRPEDRSEDYAESILARAPPLDPASLADCMQGGDFTEAEVGGGRAKLSVPPE